MARLTHYVGDDIKQPLVIKHDGTAITVDIADTIKAKVVGDGWSSSTVAIDTAATGSDLANGKVVVEFLPAETATWAAGQVTWELERTPTGTSEPQTYQYTNAVIRDDNI